MRIFDKINRVTDQVVAQYLRSVRPIYGTDASSRPIHIGSCLLIELNNRKILLTAAHVIDNNWDSNSSLYVAGDSELVLIEAQFHLTGKVNGSRNLDYLDFAAAELPGNMLNKMQQQIFISMSNIFSGLASNHYLFVALGYPNSRHKTPSRHARVVSLNPFSYTNSSKSIPALNRTLGYGGVHHTILCYEKYSLNEIGMQSSSTNPEGLSGGPLIAVAFPRAIDFLADLSPPIMSLVGMVIKLKRPNHALVCVNMSAMMQCLTIWFP